jgi:signal transduction histidine kinase
VAVPGTGKPGSLLKVTTPASTPRGRLQVVAELPLTRVQNSVDAVDHVLRIVLPLLVVAAGGLAWVLVGRALRPVDAMREEVDEITHTTITRRVREPASHDEIRRLARTMNAMLGRLETTARRQRQFVSNASHELRSPLASAHAILEAAVRSPEDADWPRVAHEALDEQERLATIIDELLELARFDETSSVSECRTVDLDEVVFTEAQRLHGKELDLGAVSGARVEGDPGELARLVRNLLRNAERHARRHVVVALTEARGRVALTVDDDGPGIPEPDRRRVFDRFVRRDDARAREDGGVGLGLALVASIVEHHHGDVTIEDSPLGGARFRVSLPQADAERSALAPV